MLNKGLGLKYCGEDEELYYTLLSNFYKRYKNHLEDLNKLDMNDKRILVHSIKGISLNVGSEELFEIAKKQETLLMEKDEILEDYKNIFIDILKSLKEVLKI